MKKVTMAIAFAAAVIILAGSMKVSADHDGHYKDLYELKQLHAAFHNAVSHAGKDAATKVQHLTEILALWTDDGTLISGGVTYSGKGVQVPGTATCEPSPSLTLCDLYANVAKSFVVGNDWVSLTPIFTETISLVDDNDADIYYQCIYFDVTDDVLKSNVTFGLPGQPNTGRARKVKGQWLLSYAEVQSITPPTLDVPF